MLSRTGRCVLFFALISLVAACGASSAKTARRAPPTGTPSSTTPVSGASFQDPQDTYTMTIGHDWQEMSGTVVAEIEAWIVAPPSDGFAANVNVLTQKAPGIDLQGYRDLSIKNGDRVMQNFELIDSGVVKGPSGSTLGWMDFTGRSGGRDLRFLAVYGLLNGQARLATLTAPPDKFSELRSRIEPYLLTLIPI